MEWFQTPARGVATDAARAPEVARVADVTPDGAFVVIDSYDPDRVWGPVVYTASQVLPVRGDVCLVLRDEDAQLWVVAWGPDVAVRLPPQADGDKSYTHHQDTPSDVWLVTHDLGKRPIPQVFTSAGDEVQGAVAHLSADVMSITFSAALAGVAYLN